MEGGVKIDVFRQISSFISKTVQDKAIINVYKTLQWQTNRNCDLSKCRSNF